MTSATVRGPYASINTIFDPPKFSLDHTFNCSVQQKLRRVKNSANRWLLA